MQRFVSLFALVLASLFALAAASSSLPVDVAAVQQRALSDSSIDAPSGLEKRRKRRHSKKHSSKPSSLTNKKTIRSGDATYFDVGLGACGKYNKNTDMIAAASHELYDTYPGHTANPNNNPICGKKVRATYKGHSITVSIVDRCEGCKKWDLDFSPTAFKHFAPLREGRLHGMKWHWL